MASAVAPSSQRVDDEEIMGQIEKKLIEWEECETANEYFDIPYRNPFKKQISDPLLNRFGGSMGPYADSLITDIDGVPYINASAYPADYLPGNSPEYSYIATMCPKLETFEHFWLMAWAKKAKLIVNLTEETESARHQVINRSDIGHLIGRGQARRPKVLLGVYVWRPSTNRSRPPWWGSGAAT